MSTRTWILLAVLVSTAIACVLVRSSPRGEERIAGEQSLERAPAPGARLGAAGLSDARDAPGRAVAGVPGPRPGTPVAPRDVLAALESAFAAGDEAAIDALVRALVEDPRAAPACLDALRAGSGATAAQQQAASLFLTTACAVGPEAVATRDYVIRELAGLPEDARDVLVHMLAGARGANGPILDAGVVPVVLAALRLHPEAAESLAPLLGPIAWDREVLARHRGALVELAAASGSPAITAAALRALWRLDPLEAEAVSALGDAAAGDRSPLSRARIEAAAEAAPIDSALAIVATGAAIPEFGALRVLGERDGALDALRDEYSSLALAGGPAERRVAIVAAMHLEEPATLLGVARTDTDPRVRAQALLTLTANRAVGPEAVQALREMRADRAFGIPASTALAAAENVLVLSRGAAREEARALLLELSADPALSAAQRQRAEQALERRDPGASGSWDGWVPPPAAAHQAGT